MSGRFTAMPHIAAPTKWVVWSPEDAGPAPELRLHGWEAEVHHNIYDAFAQVCLCEHSDCARQSWGLARREQISLVLAGEDCETFLADLLASLARFAPDVSVWRAHNGRLTAVSEESHRPPLSPPKPPTPGLQPTIEILARSTPNPPSRPRPKMHCERDRHQLVDDGHDATLTTVVPQMSISADELAMLLGDHLEAGGS